MIEILGASDASSEFRASERLKDLILEEWPEVESSPGHDIVILPSIKCYGEPVEDVDILLAAHLAPAVEVNVDGIGRVHVENLCLTLEVKDKQRDQIEFVGNKVYVTYRGKKESVSEQSRKQVFAVKNYLARSSAITRPYVTNLIWLTQVPSSGTPQELLHNTLGGDCSWLDVVRRVAHLDRSRIHSQALASALGKGREMVADVRRVFGARLQATRLDRERIERICSKAIRSADYWGTLGTQLLVFRGRGGAGKTVHLLRVAHHLYDVEGARVLILTYNNALVSDIRRLFALIGLRNTIASPRVEIRTVHSYMGMLLRGLCISSPDEMEEESQFYSNYQGYLDTAWEVVRTREGRAVFDAKPVVSAWDYVLVDEAQDWSVQERDLLVALFPSRCVILADGIDARVRETRPADWLQGADKRQIVPLQKLLRLKSGLCDFVTTFADHLGVTDWKVAPNNEAHGGRVIIAEGDLSSYWPLHDELVEQNRKDGNQNVDMLFCVRSTVPGQESTAGTASGFAAELRRRGYLVWDGTDRRERKTFPTKIDQLRIVNYDSCRGLEGWTVVCLGFDQFYEDKLRYLRPSSDELGEMFFDHEHWVRDATARWMLIPATRAIDTLVLQVTSKQSHIGELLASVKRESGDLVEWVK